jgi:hypothetical protein
MHAINKFRHYITGYETFIHTDHYVIKFLMNKPITNGRITRWLLLLQEFNITIVDRPGKENLVADFLSRIHNNDENTPIDDSFPNKYLFVVSTNIMWFADIANYLAMGKLPQHLSPRERQQIVKNNATYSWIGGDLFRTGPDMIFRRCVREYETYDILKTCHDSPYRGHFTNKRIAYKVLHQGYYWPTLFKDTKKYVSSCDSCQRMGKPAQVDEMPLQTQVLVEPFERWALDFVRPISPYSWKKR